MSAHWNSVATLRPDGRYDVVTVSGKKLIMDANRVEAILEAQCECYGHCRGPTAGDRRD
jgi:hypothetical protein